MVTGYSRGNLIKYINNQWVYEDGIPIEQEERVCTKCGRMPIKEGYDACLGTLIGVMNACCGHGEEDEAYIQFLDSECIRGKDAVAIIEILKRHSKQ